MAFYDCEEEKVMAIHDFLEPFIRKLAARVSRATMMGLNPDWKSSPEGLEQCALADELLREALEHAELDYPGEWPERGGEGIGLIAT